MDNSRDAAAYTVEHEYAAKPDHIGVKLRAIQQGFLSLAEVGNGPPAIAKDVARCSHLVDNWEDEDQATSQSLTDKEVLNWCRTARPLVLLSVSGPGSRLVQAISVALWGFSDAAKLFHRMVYVLLSEFSSAWKLESRLTKQCGDHGYQQADVWDAMWMHIKQLHLSSSDIWQERDDLAAVTSPTMADSFQLFIIANALKRSIVVLSDDEAKSGIYLPLEVDPADCIKHPLVLACSDGRFSPLVGYSGQVEMERAVDLVPLVTSRQEPLRIWFLLDEEEPVAHELQKKYLTLFEVNLTRQSTSLILGAKLVYSSLGSTLSRIPAENDEGTLDLIGLRPSAPTFSTLSLERTGTKEPTLNRDLSMLPEECIVSGCSYHASKHTHPFCYDHVNHGSSSAAAVHVTEVVEPSMTTSRCHQSGCCNYASCFIYPYCYEHIDRKIVANTLTQPSPTRPSVPELSLTSINCQHHGCVNVASQFVYPYCYEHIESRVALAQHHEENLVSIMEEHCAAPACGNRASVWTYPVCYEHLDYINRESKNIATHSPVTRTVLESQRSQHISTAQHQPGDQPSIGSERFIEAMSEVEARTRSTAIRCKQRDCPNYGNSRSFGFCNDCFSLRQHRR